MITLTYKNSEDWKPHHMGKFTKWLKRNLGDSLKSYAWVAELQERGAMHYHLIAYVSKETNIPFPDKAYGNKNFVGWPYGHSKVENARVGQYLASYVSKEHQKDYYRFRSWVNILQDYYIAVEVVPDSSKNCLNIR